MGLDSVRLMSSRDETWTHTETPGMKYENRDAEEGPKGGGAGGREDGGAGGLEDNSARAGCVTTP